MRRLTRPLLWLPTDVGKASTGQPPPTAALLSKDGAVVFVGQPRGVLTVVDTSYLLILDVIKVFARFWFEAMPDMLTEVHATHAHQRSVRR